MIPFLDVGATYRELKGDIDTAIQRVLNSGWYVLGPEVEAFESEWAEYCGADHAVGVANGLDALTLALRALDVGKGDEVIVPSNTYIATWLAVSAVGATPIPVEPGPQTFNIDPDRIRDAVSPLTKAIIPVHLYGQPADMYTILEISRECHLAVIEDAAQCHGALHQGKKIGAHGDIVCWSFYPGKNLGAFGDAGGITTNRTDLADRVRTMRNYGSRRKYLNEVQGVNSRLDNLQAAILRAKLPHLDEWIDRRRRIARMYSEGLEGTGLILPRVPEWADPAWHLYVVRSDHRDELQKKLREAGIDTLIHYPVPPHRQAAYSSPRFVDDDLRLANQLADQVLSLPMGPHLSETDATQVVEAVRLATAQF